VARVLSERGHNVVSTYQPADIYILNTCAVTGIAEKKSRECLAKFKKLNPNAKVVVCGCASQHNAEQFLSHDNVSAVIGTSGKNKIADILEKTGNLVGEIPTSYETFGVATTSKIRAYLKIQDGCNNFCSYCLIPYVRGRSRSRELSDIVCEAKELDKFNKEIILTGINISDYRIDGKLALATLMNSLSGLNARIRISSLEVNVITPELLEVLKSMPNFCPQFHLSMQSGCDRILRLMNRRYTSKEFLSKVELIRSYFPNAGITTDVIVGFPTETDEDFSETVQTIKKANFFEMHIFPYSKRDGTVASKMKMVDGNVVKSRVCELEKINQNAKQNYILSQSKNILTVLTENTENGYMVGHTENYIKIYLPQTAPSHEFVKITNFIPFLDGAKAEIVKS
jgi:threonylcarbamoyladenosine tRNA methylthiotransferase MtaB